MKDRSQYLLQVGSKELYVIFYRAYIYMIFYEGYVEERTNDTEIQWPCGYP